MINITRKCMICHDEHIISIPLEGYYKWRNGIAIEIAIPDASPETRQLLMSTVCPDCWAKL